MSMDMQKMMKQAQQLQAKLEKTQQELEKETLEVSSGGGAITVVITGHQQVQSVKIAPEAAEDVEMLEDLVLAAVNEAIRKSQELASSRLGALTAGMNIPGLT
ncbi:MAG: YbaB/EbfC family nucleoid-associated protein [Chloroflexota bacterium]|nr:YbaB/EbfC family nucleoid-associated protein [Chloroflexota bacterium]